LPASSSSSSSPTSISTRDAGDSMEHVDREVDYAGDYSSEANNSTQPPGPSTNYKNNYSYYAPLHGAHNSSGYYHARQRHTSPPDPASSSSQSKKKRITKPHSGIRRRLLMNHR
jgi:hypothetical protein